MWTLISIVVGFTVMHYVALWLKLGVGAWVSARVEDHYLPDLKRPQNRMLKSRWEAESWRWN